MIVYDGHIHTAYCPHGSDDTLESYVEAALKSGYKGMTFTEHAPLPKGFTDPSPEKDSAMSYSDLSSYLNDIKQLKQYYKKSITINIGLEVDFIEGYEAETKQFLNEVGPELDDAILSVHFLQHSGNFTCIDFNEEVFGELVHLFGSVENVYEHYYKTVLLSIETDLGKYKPKRVGHLTLVKKFQRVFPCENAFEPEILTILDMVKEKNMALDYNGAGVIKPNCKEPYPPDWVINEAHKRKIPLVYGSDAHTTKGLGQGFERLLYKESLTAPFTMHSR
ncbi:histidinol-phosphatase HisJ [Fictibacillus sp. Mic-4]|uniref:histidinol-phosphatase HisJ n=1 Tax=Fictibacillus sp. Mic-4 TaxID=3132826 RepID=UPI003CF74DD8